MSVESEIQALLAGNAALAALVGSRIYPVQAPQNCALPYVMFLRADGSNLGSLNARGAHDLMQFSFGCVDDIDQPMRAIAVSIALRKALDGYSGDGALQAARFVGQQHEVLGDPERPLRQLVTLHFSILVTE